MNFWIQAGSPQPTGSLDPDDSKLGEAIEAAFPLQTENALLVWQNIYVPLSYKYNFGTIVDDVLDVLESVLDASDGQTSVHWPSNTFNAEWRLTWQAGTMEIDAKWHTVAGGTEALLNAKGPLCLPVRSFLAEWRKPMQIMANALKDAGHSSRTLPGLHRLQNLAIRISEDGCLYAPHAAR